MSLNRGPARRIPKHRRKEQQGTDSGGGEPTCTAAGRVATGQLRGWAARVGSRSGHAGQKPRSPARRGRGEGRGLGRRETMEWTRCGHRLYAQRAQPLPHVLQNVQQRRGGAGRPKSGPPAPTPLLTALAQPRVQSAARYEEQEGQSGSRHAIPGGPPAPSLGGHGLALTAFPSCFQASGAVGGWWQSAEKAAVGAREASILAVSRPPRRPRCARPPVRRRRAALRQKLMPALFANLRLL